MAEKLTDRQVFANMPACSNRNPGTAKSEIVQWIMKTYGFGLSEALGKFKNARNTDNGFIIFDHAEKVWWGAKSAPPDLIYRNALALRDKDIAKVKTQLADQERELARIRKRTQEALESQNVRIEALIIKMKKLSGEE